MSSKIYKIQNNFFDLVLDHFGQFYGPLENQDPIKSAELLATSSTGKILEILPQLRDDIFEFWEKNHIQLYSEIYKVRGLKAGFHGDISPIESENVISRTALYVDSILIPDPLLKMLEMPLKIFKKRHYVYYLIKHTFNILNSKDIFLINGDYPISILYPLKLDLMDQRKELCVKEADVDVLSYFSELCDKEIKSMEELDELLMKDDISLLKEIKNIDLIIPHFKNIDSPIRGLEDGEKKMKDIGMIPFQDFSSGMMLKTYVLGRFRGISDHFLDCTELKSKSLFNEENGWFLFNWKINNGSQKTVQQCKLDVDTLVINALQLDNFRWLGNIPTKKIIKIRENGELQDLRDLFRREIFDLSHSRMDELIEISKKVSYNLNQAFKKHKSEVNKLNEDYKRRYKIDGSLLVIGAIGIAASFIFPPAAALSIVGGGGLADFVIKQDEHVKKISELNDRPVGILFNSYNTES